MPFRASKFFTRPAYSTAPVRRIDATPPIITDAACRAKEKRDLQKTAHAAVGVGPQRVQLDCRGQSATGLERQHKGVEVVGVDEA